MDWSYEWQITLLYSVQLTFIQHQLGDTSVIKDHKATSCIPDQILDQHIRQTVCVVKMHGILSQRTTLVLDIMSRFSCNPLADVLLLLIALLVDTLTSGPRSRPLTVLLIQIFYGTKSASVLLIVKNFALIKEAATLT